MSYKILTKNGIDNTNIDGARGEHFNAGMRSGIVKGVLNEGSFKTNASNSIYLETCELRICGHRIVLDEPVYKTFSNYPSVNTRYSFVAQIVVDDSSKVEFSLFVQSANSKLIQDNLYSSLNGAGTYQLEIGRFTLQTDGTITDITRTADIITGGKNDGDGSGAFNVGGITVNTLDAGMEAEVDIEQRLDEETGKTVTDFSFNIPQGTKGEKGDKGDQGDKGDKGDRGEPGQGHSDIYVDGVLKQRVDFDHILHKLTRFEGRDASENAKHRPAINMYVTGEKAVAFGDSPNHDETIRLGTCDRELGAWTNDRIANLEVDNEIYFKGNIALSEEIRNHYVVDTTGLDENKYYLVTLKINAKRSRIEIFNYFNGGTPSWSSHDSKNWACCYSWEVTGGGYGIAHPYRIIQVANSRWVNDHPCLNIGQMENSSNEYVYVRGGAKYNFYTTGNVVPELHTSDFSVSSQTMPSPRTADQLSKIVPFFTDSANSINVKSLKTWSDAGYETDIYGNFKHRRKNDNDTFEIDSYDGEKSVTVKMESGNTTIAGGVTIKGYKQPNASSTANIHVISTPEFDELGVEPNANAYLKELLRWICRTYPQYKYGLFVGQCSPNSTGSFQVQIYENNVTINGLPEYSSGFYVGLSNKLCLFGTTAGNFNFREV